MTQSEGIQQIEVAVIGTGFGGLGMAIHMKKVGIEPFVILEKSDDVGGCWRDNSYPGAACDVPSDLYSFSFEQHYNWSRKYAPQQEIHTYLRYCAKKNGLLSHIQFNTEVVSAKFDEHTGHWLITSTDNRLFKARVLVAATGQLCQPAMPKLPNLDQFEGKMMHSAQWDHDYDLRGKNVAVIGTGASAIQFVPQIAKQAKKLYVFQRNAPYILPKPDRAYKSVERWLMENVSALRSLERLFTYLRHEVRFLGFKKTKEKSSRFVLAAVRGFREFLRQEVNDDELREQLIPNYPIGCKRVLISNDYLQTFNNTHVKLVVDGVKQVTKQSIITEADEEYPLDAIVFGTGFKATEFLPAVEIIGRSGANLHQVWRDGAEAYLGISISGFPNFYMLYGPNTNLAHNSVVYMLESQIGYTLKCIRYLLDNKLTYIEVKSEVQKIFNERIQEELKDTVWDEGCNSWYKRAGGKITNNWPGHSYQYRNVTRYPNFSDFILQP